MGHVGVGYIPKRDDSLLRRVVLQDHSHRTQDAPQDRSQDHERIQLVLDLQ